MKYVISILLVPVFWFAVAIWAGYEIIANYFPLVIAAALFVVLLYVISEAGRKNYE